jgi:glycosyltransferase involved in cell wall biosynthesis
VFAQRYPNFEVIVVNDGSPDTPAFEAAMGPYSEHMVYIKQENRGPSAARNAGITRARGEFIAFLDSDDLWLDEYLERQMSAVQRDALDFIYSDATLFGNSVPDGRTFMQISPSCNPVTFDNLLALKSIVILSCTVARRETILKAGLFDETFWHCEDFDLWLRIAFRGAKMACWNEILARHQVRAGSLSGSPQSMRKGRIRAYEKALCLPGLNEAQRRMASQMRDRWIATMELDDGKQLLLESKYEEARAKLNSANRFFRSPKISVLIGILASMPAFARWLYKKSLSDSSSLRNESERQGHSATL